MEVGQKNKRRLNSEINVVPYIDVMLVLLIIFMITAPLLTTGVEVDLPSADADPVDLQQGPDGQSLRNKLVLTIDKAGNYYVGEDTNEDPVDLQTARLRAAAMLRRYEDLPVYVRADESVPYGLVVEAMVMLQAAGAEKVGMVTEPLDE